MHFVDQDELLGSQSANDKNLRTDCMILDSGCSDLQCAMKVKITPQIKRKDHKRETKIFLRYS